MGTTDPQFYHHEPTNQDLIEAQRADEVWYLRDLAETERSTR